MKTNNQNNIFSDYYDSLANLLGNDNNLATEILIGEGLNIEEESEKSKFLINKLETRLKAKIRKEKFQNALIILKNIKEKLEDKSEEYIQQLLSKPEYIAMQPLFNKLEKVTEYDIQSMVDDVELLKILEDLEKESGLKND